MAIATAPYFLFLEVVETGDIESKDKSHGDNGRFPIDAGISTVSNFFPSIPAFYNTRYAGDYNNFIERGYKRLSRSILRELLREPLQGLDEKSIVVDAGVGTGDFAVWVSETTGANVIGVDISPGMLERAKERVDKFHLQDKIVLIEGTIEDMAWIPNDSVDLVMSLYDPVAYLNEPRNAITEFSRITKPRGDVVVVVDNKYDALHYSARVNGLDLIERLETNGRMRWVNDMPPVKAFTLEELRGLYVGSNLQILKILGFPIFLYPEEQDNCPNLNARTNGILADPHGFNRLLELELKYISEETAARGNHFYIHARKRR